MQGFSNDPCSFINNLIASQVRDFKLMKSEDRDPEEERHNNFYHQPYTQEAIQRYIFSHAQKIATQNS